MILVAGNSSFQKLCACFDACRATNAEKSTMLMTFISQLITMKMLMEKIAIHEGDLKEIEWSFGINCGKDRVLAATRNNITIIALGNVKK